MAKTLNFSDVYLDSFNGKYTFKYLNNKISSNLVGDGGSDAICMSWMIVLRSVRDTNDNRKLYSTLNRDLQFK